MAERNTDRIRYRYGICLNDNCEKCKSKEVQEIPARKEFVCPECGKPLRECPPPKKGGNTKLIGIIVGVVILLAIIGCIIAFSGGSEDKPVPAPVPEVKENTDSIKAAQEAAEQQRIKDSLDAVAAAEAAKKQEAERKTEPAPAAQKPAKSASGSKNLGYATFKGSWPNDVNGRMVFTSSHVIDSKDPKKRVAEAGDYVIGEWADGHLVQGIWYGSDNQVKGSIIIGR
jgi:hypothetical protein